MGGATDHEGSFAASGSEHAAAAVDVISRWEQFGGSWRVIGRTGQQVTISLCRCDGGEELQRLTSDDPALIAWLGGRSSGGAGQ